MLKPYKTPKSPSLADVTINKSRFIARCIPVKSEKEAFKQIELIRKLHYDASHNCWAYNLADGSMRYSDDGEPGGTAGMPIMDTLVRTDTKNALIIVTRYFGGILLGSGGLVRAYSRTSVEALKQAGFAYMTPCSIVEFSVDYGRYGGIEGFVRENSVVKSVDFLENVSFKCLVECDKADAFVAEIIEQTDGKSTPQIVGEDYIAK